MAVHQGNGAPPVIAYNANSDRGWNDPPTLAFASTQSASTPRKRLDLRKRVAHDCISGSGLTTGMANLSMNANGPPSTIHGQQNTYNSLNYQRMHAPPIHRGPMQPAGNAPAQPPFSSTSASYYGSGSHVRTSIPSYGTHQPMPLPGSMTPPINPAQNGSYHLSHASSMPNLQHLMQSDGSGSMQNPQSSNAPLFNVNSPYQTVATVAEPSTASSTNTEFPHVGNPLFYISSQGSQPVMNSPMHYQSNKQTTISNKVNPVMQPLAPDRNSEQVVMNKTLPSLSTTENYETSHHVRSNSMPDFKPLQEGSVTLAAPPVDGYYARSMSPNTLGQRTSSPELKDKRQDVDSNSENYSNVIDQLSFALDKCSTKIDAKLYDDVRRKLDILENQWYGENLKKEVKDRMVSLAKAISGCNFKEADRIHQSLIVDFSSEVNQWMIGIKKLIAACQT